MKYETANIFSRGSVRFKIPRTKMSCHFEFQLMVINYNPDYTDTQTY